MELMNAKINIDDEVIKKIVGKFNSNKRILTIKDNNTPKLVNSPKITD